MPVDAAIVAAGISAASAGAQAAAQGKLNKKNRQWQEDRYDRQRSDSLSDWERQNAYNSPAQQMQRLREANLNPHLIYGSGGASQTASSIPQSQTPQYNPKAPDVGAIMTSPVNAYLETRSFQAQQKLIDAQTLKTLSEVDTKLFDLSQKQRLADTQATIMQEIATGRMLQNKISEANIEKIDLQTRGLLQDISQSSQKHEYELLKRSQDLRKGAQEIINLRIDAVNKQLESQLKSGAITRQYYEKETNRLDQLHKYATTQAILDAKKSHTPEDVLKVVNTLLGIGSTFIK